MRPRTRFLISLGIIPALCSTSFAGYCKVVGTAGVFSTTANAPLTTAMSPFLGDVCGFTVYADSGTCYFKIVNDDSVGSGNCITIGRGVTVSTDGLHSINCTGTACGTAISNGAGSTGNTNISGVRINGCFSTAIEGGSYSSELSDSVIDLTGTNCKGVKGIGYGWNPVDKVIVSGASAQGVEAEGLVSNSIIHNCEQGIDVESQGVTIDNVLLQDNKYSIYNHGILYPAPLKSSVLLEGPTTQCHCTSNGTSCASSLTSCISYAGQPTMVDGEIWE